jgi:Flp pilus assembly protein TadG
MGDGALTTIAAMPSEASCEPSRPARKCLLDRLRRHECGTAVVEFALIAPLLFLLVGGVIDFARAMNYYNDMTQLAGQGARAAIVAGNPDGTSPSTATSVQCQLINTYTTSSELKGTTSSDGIQVQIVDPNNLAASGVNPIAGLPLTVKTSFDFKFLVPLVKIAVPGSFLRLTTSSTMRVEQRAATAFSTTPQNVTTC